jgi:hypothetical protein
MELFKHTILFTSYDNPLPRGFMNLKFIIKEVYGVPYPVFEEIDYKYYLIGAFLRQARPTYGFLYAEVIEKIERNSIPADTLISEFAGDDIDVEFYSDRVIITEFYPEDENNPQSTTISLPEAKEVLLEWQKALKIWHESKEVR